MKNFKFSLITPEHNPGNVVFLLELYDTIRKQTYDNWEWILYLNNKCLPENIPDIIKNDPKVIVIRTDDTNGNIGAIKNAAFSLGTGDILVEADQRTVLALHALVDTNDDGAKHVTLLHATAGNGFLHGHDDHVTDAGVATTCATQHLDAHDPASAGVVGDFQVSLHLDHGSNLPD